MKKYIIGALLALTLLMAGWASIRPATDRNWVLGQQVNARAAINPDSVTITNLRDFRYDSGAEPRPAYDTRTYDLDKVQTVWFILAPFDSDNRGPAHTFLSFGFSDSQFVAVSVEARREVGEDYSILKGIFKRFELMYVIGDERDLIGQRIARNDDVYLYPIKTTPEKARRLFVQMLERANALEQHPEFYNTLTNNCTTNILEHVNSIASRKIPYGREVLLPGYSDELARELGLLDTGLSMEEARKAFYINERARAAPQDSLYSLRIRNG